MYDTIIDEFDDDVSPTTEENFSKLPEDSAQAGATAPAAKEEPQPAVVKSRKKGEATLPSSEDNESWSEDPVRMYLTQMGEIPLLYPCGRDSTSQAN